MSYDLEDIEKELKNIEQENEQNYSWRKATSLVEHRAARTSEYTKREDVERLKIIGAHVEVEIYPDNIETGSTTLNRNSLSERDRKLLDYTEGIK